MTSPPPEAALAALPPLRDVIRRHGLGARRSLGQHFLLDMNLTGRIARATGPLAGKTVLEVGPGPGGLTRALIAAGARVVAVERDRRCLAALAELAEALPGRLEVIEADALEFDETQVLTPPITVVANLPYNISTVLLFKWLDDIERFERLTLMFQREVADRLAAGPGSKSYGRLSVMTQWRAEVEPLFEIAPSAFTPPPKVTSRLVRITPRAQPLAPARPSLLARVVQAAFGQRRKMLRQSLRTLGQPPGPVLTAADVAPTARAEDLDIDAFCRLARALEAAVTGPRGAA